MRSGVLVSVAFLLVIHAEAADKSKREWKAGVVEWASAGIDPLRTGMSPAGGAPAQTVRETIDIGTPEAIYTAEQAVLPRQTLGYREGDPVRFVVERRKLILLDRAGKERKLDLKAEYPRSAAERERRAAEPR